MPTLVGVKVAEGCDRAPAPCQVGEVEMTICDRPQAEIEGGCSEYGDRREKVAFELVVPLVKMVERRAVVRMEVWGVCLKQTWAKTILETNREKNI